MKIKPNKFLISLGLLFASLSYAGGEVQNGGDFVLCARSDQSPYVGYFSLDYLLTLQNENGHVVEVKTWEESKKRILIILQQKYPDLEILFKDFLARIPGETTEAPGEKYFHQRIWDDTPYGLEDISDEKILRKVPANCYNTKKPGQINVIQAVVREQTDKSIVYNYDSSIFSQVKKSAALQYSFLILHEWLWDYIDDVNTIRRVNRFLHSNLADELKNSDFKLVLENLGLTLKYNKFRNVCTRSESARIGIERETGHLCTEIKYNDLMNEKIIDLKLRALGATSFVPGDFNAFGLTKSLDLSDNRVSFLFEDTFYGLFKLEYLLMSNNQLKKIPDDLLKASPNLRMLDFSGNQLSEISGNLLRQFCNRRMEDGTSLVLSVFDNPIEKIDLVEFENCLVNNPRTSFRFSFPISLKNIISKVPTHGHHFLYINYK